MEKLRQETEARTTQARNTQVPGRTPKPGGCLKKCNFGCTKHFSEADRQTICLKYWKMGKFERQRDFIIRQVAECGAKTHNTKLQYKKKCQKTNFFYQYFGYIGQCDPVHIL